MVTIVVGQSCDRSKAMRKGAQISTGNEEELS